MTIEYKEDEILERERLMSNRPLIGYINPQGEIINYSKLIGECGHGNWRNPATPVLLDFVSFVMKGDKIKTLYEWEWDEEKTLYYDNKYEGFDDIVKRGLEFPCDVNYTSYDEFLEVLDKVWKKEKELAKFHAEHRTSFGDRDVFEKLKYDLVNFFKKLYSNRNFFGSLGRVIYAENSETICEMYKVKGDIEKANEFYYNYLIVQLMSYMKDFCVQYLKYDSIERAWPLGDLNRINNLYSASNGYTFSPNPRIITTSAQNINERFYNWLLMDWEIQKVPRKVWNEDKKKFEDEPYVFEYVYKDKEEILGKEIDSIKRLVPREERYKYFR